MSLRALFLVPLALLFAASPAAADQAKSITATGTGQARVIPANRNDNASIVAAVDGARKAGVAGAMSEAQEYAQTYATAAGLTLGSIISVSDAQNSSGGYAGSGPAYFGGGPGPIFVGGGPFGAGGAPFGPNQYCGTVRQPVFKGVGKKRRFAGLKSSHHCFVPQFEFTTLTVTYSAT